jgi:hypothetical protein
MTLTLKGNTLGFAANLSMKRHSFASTLGLVFTLFFLVAMDTHAQLGKAEVQGVKGTATYIFGGGSPLQVRRGLALPAGSVVYVDRDSAVDLYFGAEVGTIRLTQGSVLSLDKLDRSQTYLTLVQGTIVGWDAIIPATSEYQVKLPNGIVGVVHGKYRLDARSYLVLINGALIYGYAAPGGEVKAYTMKTPPGVYFSPVEGVRPAPTPLQREVELQTKGKLR